MTMRITSAYNFAPLSHKVVQPDWQDLVSHDLPLEDGLCAELDVELEAHTPLLVGKGTQRANGNEPATVSFYKLPDGRPAIPGSSVRGMLRNVLEIATHARLAPLMDDRAMSLRDLNLSDYRKALTKSGGREGPFETKTKGGWLRFDAALKQWRVHPCEVLRIFHTDLTAKVNGETLHELMSKAYRKESSKDAQRMARLKYEAISKKVAYFYRGDSKPETYRHGKEAEVKRLIYRRAWLSDKANMTGAGYLVFTGQPGNLEGPGDDHKSGTKHIEFLFDSREGEGKEVPAEVMVGFHQIYSESSDLKYLSGPDSPHVKRGIPVFFLEQGNAISSLGLSQMYRLPGKHTLGEIAALQQAAPKIGKPLDFVQTLFGHVLDDQPALKGRISVGDFLPSQGSQPSQAEGRFTTPTVLGAPKPSFYPSYFEQAGRLGQLSDGESYSTVLSEKTPKLRGWKRYPVRIEREVELTPPPDPRNLKVQVRLQPLAAGSKFTGTIRLHNVKREELGALLWALNYGEKAELSDARPALRHALGMGKPFGFGQVSLRSVALRVRTNDPTRPSPTEDQLRQTFEEFMQDAVPQWAQSAALKELRAMANPIHPNATRANLVAMGAPDKFVAVKKTENKAVLPGFTQLGSVRTSATDHAKSQQPFQGRR